MPAMQAVVRARDLGYRYGRRVALRGLDLDVRRGEILGLVGPNGSGKTTFLKLLAGFLRPTEGSLEVLGSRPFEGAERLFQRVRFAFAPPALFERFTAREHLVALGGLGAKRPSATEVERALAQVGLAGRADEDVAGFSFGMRQRLAVAQALVPLPEVLVLDEPNDGLDPQAVRELRELLARLRDEHGTTVVLSSHLMLEVERLVDRLVVLREGEALFVGAPAELFSGRERVRLRVEGRPQAAAARLLAAGYSAVVLDDGALELREAPSLAEAHALFGAALREHHTHRPGLEQVLLELFAAGTRGTAP